MGCHDAVPVSVVIPCHNGERHLAATIESVIAQDAPAWELVVIDDGSTDGTAAIIDRYRQVLGERLVAEAGPNRGVSAARNRGTALARGRYLQYLDADDVLRPGSLRAKFEALEASGDDVAYSDWQELVETTSGAFAAGRLHARRWEDVSPVAEIAAFSDFWAPPAALLYRRAIVDRIEGGFSASLPMTQDGRFLFDAVRLGARLRHVAMVGADYRIAKERRSLSQRDRAGFMRDWARYAFDVEALWRAEGALDDARRLALLRRFGQTTRALYELDRPAFWRIHRHMQSLDPAFIPAMRPALRIAARILGYPRAEALALAGRRVRRRMRAARE
ncbi:MAG TPA: glycosyltransferase [Casimicrobiaceae bacterium]|jgi:glycosyltransferase involved in cell wall biosynthesis|nr:glycosyltransferase [Casimicrobiaceae bacterium]